MIGGKYVTLLKGDRALKKLSSNNLHRCGDFVDNLHSTFNDRSQQPVSSISVILIQGVVEGRSHQTVAIG